MLLTSNARIQCRTTMWDLWWTNWHWSRFVLEPLRFSPVSLIPQLLHTNPSSTPEIYDGHEHILSLSSRGFISYPALAWLQSKEVSLYREVRLHVSHRNLFCRSEMPSSFWRLRRATILIGVFWIRTTWTLIGFGGICYLRLLLWRWRKHVPPKRW
jgi:hypothetical protein